MDKKIIAMYLRLSGEDKDISRNESNSIANQRQLILDYIQSNKTLSGCEIREFADDGVSGARFDRAAFQEMIGQVRNGEIKRNLILLHKLVDQLAGGASIRHSILVLRKACIADVMVDTISSLRLIKQGRGES